MLSSFRGAGECQKAVHGIWNKVRGPEFWKNPEGISRRDGWKMHQQCEVSIQMREKLFQLQYYQSVRWNCLPELQVPPVTSLSVPCKILNSF